jgi:hypothetical protein
MIGGVCIAGAMHACRQPVNEVLVASFYVRDNSQFSISNMAVLSGTM